MRAAFVGLLLTSCLLVLFGTALLVKTVLKTNESATVACDIQARGLKAQHHLEQALRGAVLVTAEAKHELGLYLALERQQPKTRDCK